MINEKIVVLYHADCADGFGAAFAAWKKFGEEALYIAVHHDTDPPKEIEEALVYTLDYSYKPEVIDSFKSKMKKLIIIDHHVTAKESVSRADESVLEIEHSGSVLAWNYFHPKEPVPKLLLHIEDGDIWKFQLPGTRELYESLMMRSFDFLVWDKLITEWEDPDKLASYLKEGELLLRRKELTVNELLENAEEVEFEGYTCKMVNSPLYASLIGNKLVEAGSPIGIIWSRRENKIIVSLRSSGEPDVAALAEKYGGGGHKAAAGFSWEEEEFLRFKKPGESL